MPAIFYDLETTDTLFSGQILNYCFIAVDKSFVAFSTLKGLVRLSRLQMPTPGAILANKVNVINHQDEAVTNEALSMRNIYDYINSIIDDSDEPVIFVGYNSTKFDLPFLRTSLIRNGLNPYFNGRLIYKDLLHCVRYLSCHDKSFPRPINQDKQVLSLALEPISSSLGLLEVPQKHESEEDVMLTIDLAKCLNEKFKLNLFDFNAYQASKFEKPNLIVNRLSPQYSLAEDGIAVIKPMICLDADYRSSLWIDLNKYEESRDRESIFWVNKRGGEFFCLCDEGSDRLTQLGNEALSQFSMINLNNYFQKSICDIELDIYRLDIDCINALHQAIWLNDQTLVKSIDNKDLKVLLSRFKLANYTGNGEDLKFREKLDSFLSYKYSGKMLINKFLFDRKFATALDYHPSRKELEGELETFLKQDLSDSDRELLIALKQLYKSVGFNSF